MSYRTPEAAAAYNREWYAKNKDRVIERNRKWLRENPEKKAAQSKRRKERDPDLVRALCNAASKRHYHANIDVMRAKQRAFKRQENIKFPERKRAQRLKKYGLTLAQWDAMFEAQGRRCAICRSDTPGGKAGWNTDHCHKSGRVRFILCAHCNRGLGAFKDDPALMRAAAEALERLPPPDVEISAVSAAKVRGQQVGLQ